MHSHMTNTRNTPIEAFERHYPMRVREYALRTGSGGEGAERGGDGLIRSVEMLVPAEVTLMTERRTLAPGGVAGGAPGARGMNRLTTPEGETVLPAKCTVSCDAGTIITVETPGGGGWGIP
jgi:N-methylhydantoinase B